MAVITLTTQPQVDPPAPAPTYYESLSAEIQTAIDTLATLLPKLDEALSTDAQQVRRNLNVPDAFCYTVLNAVEQTPELNAGNILDVEKCRDEMQFIEAFGPVLDKFFTVGRQLRHALRMKKSSAGTATLQVLRVAKAQASRGRKPAVSAQIELMQRDLGRKTSLTKAERAERKALKLAQSGKEVQAPTA